MSVVRRLEGPLRRQWRRVSLWLLVFVYLAIAAVLLYFGMPFHGSQDSVESTLTDDRVEVSESGGTYVLEPAEGSSETGLVFYPGARVHPDAYLSSLAPVVREAGVTVVVPKLPLNLAVLDQNAATDVIDRREDVEQWYVGGHSLGGAMACRYARSNPEKVEGVTLFGAYCDKSIADTDLRALVVNGQEDTVLDRDAYEQSIPNLPDEATVEELPGVNHTQFGSYTGQPGDEPSGTSYEVAHQRLANVTVPWFTATFSRSGDLTPFGHHSRQKLGEKHLLAPGGRQQ